MIYITENELGYLIQEERYSERVKKHNDWIIQQFVDSKKLEGVSENTISNYVRYMHMLSDGIGKNFEDMTAKNIKAYMTEYQSSRRVTNNTMDNMRLVFSSFYNYLVEEDFVIKNPMRKIHKIKGEKVIKSPFTDDDIIHIQDSCRGIREKALIDFLYSTGCRVSEVCDLNVRDVDFINKEVLVFGKGSKERVVYFDARTKIHLHQYIESRTDTNPALFVTDQAPFNRISKTGIEYIVANIGQRAKVPLCHPHRFRRTLATRLIDRGVPIEQVQRLLGHTKIDTTLIYAQVSQRNVKMSHNKFA